MFTRVVSVLILMIISSYVAIAGEREDKIRMLRSVDATYHRLLDLADSCTKGLCGSRSSIDTAGLNRTVGKLVGEIDDPAVLFRLSVISRVSQHPGKAGLEPVDLVFGTAWRLSIMRLGSLHTAEALRALRSFEAMISMDGEVSFTVTEAIENAERGLKSKH